MVGVRRSTAPFSMSGRSAAPVPLEDIMNSSLSLRRVAAVGILVVAGLVAGWFPARAASRVNPIEALRSE